MFTASLDYAMQYCNHGLAVLPLHFPVPHQGGLTCSCSRSNCPSPAKHPLGHLVPNGLKDASTEKKKIEYWFRDSSWNVGIVTGHPSGIIALDIDPRHGGDESIASLESINGPLPRTCKFLTGGGGEHILFRHPGGLIPNSSQRIAPGIDVRADGGYIVGPPSRHISGRPYAISVDHHPDDIPLAKPPGWLLAAMRTEDRVNSQGQKPAEVFRTLGGSTIPEGQRNDNLARIVGHLLGHHVDHHLCLELMIAFNATHCEPPLSEDEVLRIVASIGRREEAKQAAKRRGLRHG